MDANGSDGGTLGGLSPWGKHVALRPLPLLPERPGGAFLGSQLSRPRSVSQEGRADLPLSPLWPPPLVFTVEMPM